MKTISQNPRIMWFQEPAVQGSPDLEEQDFFGSLSDAVDSMTTRAMESNFILGQVLEHDGRVYATIGKGGATRLASPLPA